MYPYPNGDNHIAALLETNLSMDAWELLVPSLGCGKLGAEGQQAGYQEAAAGQKEQEWAH